MTAARSLISFFSGIVDPYDRVRLGGYPAPWRELLGLRVEEFAPLPEGLAVRLEGSTRPRQRGGTAGGYGRTSSTCAVRNRCCLRVRATSPAQPAVTRHAYGRGEAFYLGTLPDRATLRDLMGQACGRAGIEFRTDLPPGVEAVRRGDYLFVISHLDHAVELALGRTSRDLLTSEIVGPAAALGPRGVLVLTAQD